MSSLLNQERNITVHGGVILIQRKGLKDVLSHELVISAHCVTDVLYAV
jgi:hypothetical protein